MAGDATEQSGKNKGGRPTKLTAEMVDRAEQYLIDVENEKITVKFGLAQDGSAKWAQTAPKLPNHARLAYILGISKQRLYDWQEARDGDNEEMTELRQRFRDCISHVKALQEAMLNENGAAGSFNSQVTNRILAAQHGYKDRVDQTSDDKPITTGPMIDTPEHAAAVQAYNETMRKLLTKRKEPKE